MIQQITLSIILGMVGWVGKIFHTILHPQGGGVGGTSKRFHYSNVKVDFNDMEIFRNNYKVHVYCGM